jgi:NAD(P)-dependent dehydrogenase (short-subunit alcohol dehydrogenase family)
MRLEDKIVIVTGAVQGIGRAAAERFAQEGAVALVVDLDRARGEATLGDIV